MFAQKYLWDNNAIKPTDKFASNEVKYVKAMYNEYYLQALNNGKVTELMTREQAEAVIKEAIPDFMEGFVVTDIDTGKILNIGILRGGNEHGYAYKS